VATLHLGIEELERRMRPGAWSDDGFLGETESLSEVLARDERTLAELGITCDELADDLALLIEAADYAYLPLVERFPADWPRLEESKMRLERIRAKVEAHFGTTETQSTCVSAGAGTRHSISS
jgi:hypothetical protein